MGTRKLTWLAKDGTPAPDALAFRDAHSTLYVEGVMTLIPLDRLESLIYDAAKKTVAAKVAGPVESPGLFVEARKSGLDVGVAGRHFG